MLQLAAPWALALLPLPLPCWFFLPPYVLPPLSQALRVPFFAAVEKLIEQEKTSQATAHFLFLPFLVWSLVVFALAGPRWVGDAAPVGREGYHIMMALDLSASMEVTDRLENGRYVSRLAVVKRAAERFVKERPGDKIGLILFGTRAYLQTPLTYDKHSILLRIEDATPGLAGKTTSLGDALGLAVKHLEQVPKKGRVIILLTDGANNSGVLDPLKAAELAREDGMKVYTIGLGQEDDPNLLAQGFFAAGASADLDEDTLKRIAKLTGGLYFRATNKTSLNSIYQKINQLEKVKQEGAKVRPQKEYYPWVLSVALLLYFYWLSRLIPWNKYSFLKRRRSQKAPL